MAIGVGILPIVHSKWSLSALVYELPMGLLCYVCMRNAFELKLSCINGLLTCANGML